MASTADPHPPLGRRTPARTEDFFDPSQLADLRAFARPLKRVGLVATVCTGLVDLWLVFGADLGPGVVGRVDDAPWPLQLLAVATVFGVITALVGLPFDWWATMVHERRHGMSNRSSSLFVADTVKETALGVGLVGLLLVPVYAAVRTFETWWLVGGLVFFGLALVLNFIYPVAIMPRFNTFTPMAAGPLRTRIEEIADLAGTSIEGVYTMDGSRRSRRGNAFVAGFGPTKRVVVFDTMLAFPLDQIAQVVAHEIGHYRLNHIPKTFPLSAVQMLASLAFVQYVGGNETVLGWAGVDSLGEAASLPVFLFAFGIPTTLFALVSAWVSRHNEREADLEALRLLRDPSSFVAMWPGMVELNKADLEPGWWGRLNASHPHVAERMQFGIDWATMNDVDVVRPERAAVPPATSDTA